MSTRRKPAVAPQAMISVQTSLLRERLNRLYDALRANPKTYSQWGRFDYLWDIKELALMQGRNSIEIPDCWLEELEQMSGLGQAQSRGH